MRNLFQSPVAQNFIELIIMLFVICLIFSFGITRSEASTVTAKIYPDLSNTGVTTDGRMYEDRYRSWDDTVDSTSARITSVPDYGQDLSNNLGTGFGENYYGNNRLHFGFDTSLLPDDAEVISANFYFHGANIDASSGLERRIYLVSSSPASNNDLINSDYGKVGNMAFGVTAGVWSTTTYQQISLNDNALSYSINDL